MLALFSAQFGELYGFTDPADPSRALSLCELFERGTINEVWIQDGEPELRRAPLNLERKQNYDATETAIPGSFAPCLGGNGGCLDQIICGVTVRLSHLDAARGPGCDLQVRGWGIERMWDALPSLRADALAFLNRDFDSRFGVRFDGWPAICDQTGARCVTYPTPTSATGTYADGTTWTIDFVHAGLRQHAVSAQRERALGPDQLDRGRLALRALRPARRRRRRRHLRAVHGGQGRRRRASVSRLRRRLANLLAAEHARA